jgi:hypothetical protein
MLKGRLRVSPRARAILKQPTPFSPTAQSPGRVPLLSMVAWGSPASTLLDIAARRDNTPVGCHSNTKRPMEEAERTPGVRVGYRPGLMGRRPLVGTHTHRGSHRGRHKTPSMAPNTVPRMARCRCRSQPKGLPTIRLHATRPATHIPVPH